MAVAFAVVAVAVAATVANVALLNSTGEARIGRLSPVAPSPAARAVDPARPGGADPAPDVGRRYDDQDD